MRAPLPTSNPRHSPFIPPTFLPRGAGEACPALACPWLEQGMRGCHEVTEGVLPCTALATLISERMYDKKGSHQMNPAQRAKRLQAHSLRCQGLTYRQIGERMRCAHSTAAHYVRDFEANRSEIIESLAADLLVHSVANLQDPDPDLHQQHINAARELRLLVNSLDQVADRRQKRDRRIVMEQEADTIKYIEALDQLTATMRESGIDDLTPYLTDPEAFRTPHFQQPLPQTSPSGGKRPDTSSDLPR